MFSCYNNINLAITVYQEESYMLHAARFVWIFTSYSWLAVYRVFETDVGEKWRLSENVRKCVKLCKNKGIKDKSGKKHSCFSTANKVLHFAD